jgi:hypothetical protein
VGTGGASEWSTPDHPLIHQVTAKEQDTEDHNQHRRRSFDANVPNPEGMVAKRLA